MKSIQKRPSSQTFGRCFGALSGLSSSRSSLPSFHTMPKRSTPAARWCCALLLFIICSVTPAASYSASCWDCRVRSQGVYLTSLTFKACYSYLKITQAEEKRSWIHFSSACCVGELLHLLKLYHCCCRKYRQTLGNGACALFVRLKSTEQTVIVCSVLF